MRRSTRIVLPLLVGLLVAVVAVIAVAGGSDEHPGSAPAVPAAAADPGAGAELDAPLARSSPRAVQPEAGIAAGEDAGAAGTAPEDLDPDPGAVSAPTDAEIRSALRRAGIPSGNRVALTAKGLAIAPLEAPGTVRAVVAAGNRIARLPYRYGGGHGRWIDSAYDCSGSVSFAFAAAGLISGPLDSTRLARFGDPGPGRWVTIYANARHAFMTVGGLRFDTSGRARPRGSRWQGTPRPTGGFTVRHPAGL